MVRPLCETLMGTSTNDKLYVVLDCSDRFELVVVEVAEQQ